MSSSEEDGLNRQSEQSRPTDQKQTVSGPPEANLYVDNLPKTIDEDAFKKLFGPYGTIVRSRLAQDETGKKHGYALVQYSTEEEAKACIQALNGSKVDDKELKVSVARSKNQPKPPPQTNLYITGVPKTWTKTELDNIFKDYGEIKQSTILMDRTTKESRGIGFVRYESEECAQAALAALDKTTPAGCDQPLAVKLARDKETARPAFFGPRFGPYPYVASVGRARGGYGYGAMPYSPLYGYGPSTSYGPPRARAVPPHAPPGHYY